MRRPPTRSGGSVLPTVADRGDPSVGVRRLGRAAALAGVIVALAALAHLSAGGRLPGPSTFAPLTAGTLAICMAAVGRRLRFPGILILLGVGQAVLHEAFMTLAAPPPMSPGAAPPTMSTGLAPPAMNMPGHHHLVVGTTAGTADPSAGWLMIAAHAAATLGCAVALAIGERVVWTIRDVLLPRAPHRSAPLLPQPRHEVAPGWVAPVLQRFTHWRRTQRRGPPLPA